MWLDNQQGSKTIDCGNAWEANEAKTKRRETTTLPNIQIMIIENISIKIYTLYKKLTCKFFLACRKSTI